MGKAESRTISKIGNSAGVTLPAELMERLGLAVGDKVHLTVTEGGILLSPYDPDFEEALALSREVMKDYRDTLKALA